MDVATSGTNEEEALFSARELLGCVLYGLEEDNEVIPDPSSVFNIKIGEHESVILVDAYMPAVRLAQTNKSVNRTVTLPAWLNAAAQEKGYPNSLQDVLRTWLGIFENMHCPISVIIAS